MLIAITSAGGIGILLFIIGFAGFKHHLTYVSRPTVTGQVLSSEVIGRHAYRPQIVYTYSIDGENYVDTVILETPGFGGKLNRLEVAESTIHEYRAGSQVVVYYNPNRPSDSHLFTGVDYGSILQIGFGSLLVIGSIIVNIRLLRRRKGTTA